MFFSSLALFRDVWWMLSNNWLSLISSLSTLEGNNSFFTWTVLLHCCVRTAFELSFLFSCQFECVYLLCFVVLYVGGRHSGVCSCSAADVAHRDGDGRLRNAHDGDIFKPENVWVPVAVVCHLHRQHPLWGIGYTRACLRTHCMLSNL